MRKAKKVKNLCLSIWKQIELSRSSKTGLIRRIAKVQPLALNLFISEVFYEVCIWTNQIIKAGKTEQGKCRHTIENPFSGF